MSRIKVIVLGLILFLLGSSIAVEFFIIPTHEAEQQKIDQLRKELGESKKKGMLNADDFEQATYYLKRVVRRGDNRSPK